jgi:hypothetical protein
VLGHPALHQETQKLRAVHLKVVRDLAEFGPQFGLDKE